MPSLRRILFCLIFCSILILSACNFPSAPTPFPSSNDSQRGGGITNNPITQVSPTQKIVTQPGSVLPPAVTATLPQQPLPPGTQPPAPAATAIPAQSGQVPNLPDEAILIQEPGPGSRLVSPIRVAGITDPTFEQTIGIRLVLPNGSELSTSSGINTAGVGQRGPFEASVEFQTSQETNALIQVFAVSPRDGSVVHLASVGVLLEPSGAANIVPAPDHPEQIAILTPAAGNTLSGGVAHVIGYGTASFEQHLLVQIQDASGQVIGSAPVTVQSPDMGQPGPFEVDVPYKLTTAGAGRISVHDPSAAFGGDVHVSSVEIQLQP